MSKEEILNIFYNNIVVEASNGRVDCYFYYNLVFNTKIPEKNLEIYSKIGKNDMIIPTLIVNDYREFEKLLIEYVNRALKFYDDSNFDEELLISKEKGISKEKLIMTLLWSNATIEDFNDPCLYLKKRIDFFTLGELEVYRIPQLVSYSNILGADIECCIQKNRIENETPYSLQIFLKNTNINKIIYEFPRIYLGVSDDTAFIYAIQNNKSRVIDEEYVKKISRKMYKVNEGLDVKEDTYANYGFGNLKDVTPSFLVAANILAGLLSRYNIPKINVVSILISRWNAKILTLDYKKVKLIKKYKNVEEITQLLDEYYMEVLQIQTNLTDKFLRIFRRLGYHHSSIGVVSYPMEVDSNLSLKFYNQEDVCNNQLLEETFSFSKNNLLKR